MTPLLSVEHLTVVFHTYAGTVHAVSDINFALQAGEILGIVGESGCGKSVTANAIMGLIPSPPGQITNGAVKLEDENLFTLSENKLQKLRGNEISMIFQDPMTALNPVLSIGLQLIEGLMLHYPVKIDQARSRAVDILRSVGISDPETRMNQFPHQLSGGMRQRVVIAMALMCNPRILIADEPTTALDVTIQAQIADLLKSLNTRFSTAILLITHDLGIVAGLCQRVLVMYAGQIVESASVGELYRAPYHPYTWGLLQSVPSLDSSRQSLYSIAGQPPNLLSQPAGCRFAPRCPFTMDICKETPPLLTAEPDHFCRCWLTHEQSPYDPITLWAKEGA
ncbi:MAG: ABC transporter ATP-binding protein [Veillonellales bacterium]